MATLPNHPLVESVYAWRKATTPQGHRAHLGASLIGDGCRRKLWYVFRHCQAADFDGRMLRLFNTGHLAESRFTEELRGIGCDVWEVDPKTGKQIHIELFGGHFSGSLDCIAKARSDTIAHAYMGGKPHVTEFKTHGEKSFKKLQAEGVMTAKVQHYAQMQVYAHLMKLERWLYMAVNKNTDELHIERGHTDHKCAEYMIDKAKFIIESQTPPEGISDDQTWYQCRFCDFNETVCHGKKLPEVNCRTCLHSTPDTENGRWSCARHEQWVDEGMVCGEVDHLFIPALVPLEQIDAGEDWVSYDLDGVEIKNGKGGYASKELQHAIANPAVINDANVNALREGLGATLCGAWQ